MRRLILGSGFLLALAIAWFAWPRAERSDERQRVDSGALRANEELPAQPRSNGSLHSASASVDASDAAAFSEGDFQIVAPLNEPGSTISRDLETLSQLFDAWRTNFPRDGNPVGENSDITAALTGENALGFALIPKNHPAINADGELCDRWGTPFRFHQLSGEHMEIRSAGPDRKFATKDDAVWDPPQ